jgi:hypothetical protein
MFFHFVGKTTGLNPSRQALNHGGFNTHPAYKTDLSDANTLEFSGEDARQN